METEMGRPRRRGGESYKEEAPPCLDWELKTGEAVSLDRQVFPTTGGSAGDKRSSQSSDSSVSVDF